MSLFPKRGAIKERLASVQRKRTVKDALRNNDGAIDLASIMVGVIVIGIVAGVIVATVFAVIPWAQNNAAQQALGSVVTAESVQFAYSSDQGLNDFVTSADLEGATNASGSSLIQHSDSVDIVVTADDAATTGVDEANKHYLAVSKSATGLHYYITDANPSPVEQGDLTGIYATLEAATVADAAASDAWK